MSSSYISYLGSMKMFQDSYLGKGTLVVTGEQNDVKKPYVVALRLERTKGGREDDPDTKSLKTVAVIDGIGTFNTYDFTTRGIVFGKALDLKKIEKPEYKVEVLGFKQADI